MWRVGGSLSSRVRIGDAQDQEQWMGKSNFKGCIDAPPHIFLQLTPSGKAQKISTRTTEHGQSFRLGCLGAGWIEARGKIRIRVGVRDKGIELRKGH